MKEDLKFVAILFFILMISSVIAAGVSSEQEKKLNQVKTEMQNGNFDNMLKTLDEISPANSIFSGLDNSRLIQAWDRMEVKTGLKVDSVKTNKYRNLLLKGIDPNLDNGKKADSFIGGLIKRNSNLKTFDFSGIGNSKETSVDGDFINVKDASGNAHRVPLKDLNGLKQIAFLEMKSGGQGYAVHYVPEKGAESAAILSSGYLKINDKNGYDVMDNVGSEIKKVGTLSFGDAPQGAIYFKGVPRDVGKEKFSKGDYIFQKPGRNNDVRFEDDSGLLSPSERDALNGDGLRAGFQSETGVRGIKKLDINGDKKPDLTMDIVNQNSVGISYGNVVLGSKSDKKIEISAKGDDVNVKFPSGITNVEITNINGRVITTYDNREIYSAKGQPLKDVSGVINGIFVKRIEQDSGNNQDSTQTGNGFSFDGSNGRVNQGNIPVPQNNIPAPQNDPSVPQNNIPAPDDKIIIQNDQNFVKDFLNLNSGNKEKDSAELQTHKAIIQARGANLQWDENIAKKARDYSQMMATRYGLQHSSMGYAENIAYFTSFEKLSDAQVGQKFTSMWMNSRGHRNNIMSGHTREGIGIYVSGSGGQYTYWATQIFQ